MSSDDIFKIIISNTCEVIPELKDHKFQRSDRLNDLGANSIDRAEIVTMTLEALSLKIPRIELAGVSNMGELADMLHEKLQSQ